MQILRKKWQLTLTVTFASLGLLLSFQFKTHMAMDNDLNSQNNDTLAAIAKNLNTKYYELIQEVWDLRTQQKLMVQSADQDKTILEAMTREQQKLDIALGTTQAEGPGLIITIPENNLNYFSFLDLIDIINELWNAGAEAISINDLRITNSTSITPLDELQITIAVNDKKLSFPYIIKAIGEPSNLEKGISIPSGIIDGLRTVRKIPLEIKQIDKLVLTSTASPYFKYAKAVTNQAAE
jgi:uncharacterized protein YlxW (UPF0749 family)